MAGDATRARKNRKIRQEAMREQLVANGHLTHALKIIQWFQNVGDGTDTEILTGTPKGDVATADPDVLKLRMAANGKALDGHMRMVDKFLPSIKATEITGDGGSPLQLDDDQRIQRLAAILDAARDRRTGRTADGNTMDAIEGSTD